MRGDRIGRAGESSSQLGVQGLPSLVEDLRALPSSILDSLVRDAVFQAFKPALRAIQERCPVATGKLRDSLHIQVRKSPKWGWIASVTAGQGDFVGEQFYGAFVEYGTENLPAKPFMRPGFDSVRDQVLESLSKLLADGIEVQLKKI